MKEAQLHLGEVSWGVGGVAHHLCSLQLPVAGWQPAGLGDWQAAMAAGSQPHTDAARVAGVPISAPRPLRGVEESGRWGWGH